MEDQKKQLEKQLILITQIGNAISEQIDRDNPDEVLGKLQELASLQSTASNCLAVAKKLLNRKNASLITSGLFDNYSATDRKLIFLELANDEVFQLNLIERFVANISHSIDSLRSILSFKKHELDQSKYQTT